VPPGESEEFSAQELVRWPLGSLAEG
jgi:hypothetical protein